MKRIYLAPSVITEVIKVEKGFATSKSDDKATKAPAKKEAVKDSISQQGDIIFPDYEEGESYTF